MTFRWIFGLAISLLLQAVVFAATPASAPEPIDGCLREPHQTALHGLPSEDSPVLGQIPERSPLKILEVTNRQKRS